METPKSKSQLFRLATQNKQDFFAELAAKDAEGKLELVKRAKAMGIPGFTDELVKVALANVADVMKLKKKNPD